MTDTGVTLLPATEADASLLANLLELYVHDMSPFFPGVEPADDGRFGYPQLPLYWSQPDRRFAFLIRAAGKTAGFAFVTRGSPASGDPDVLDVAEFFVLRGHRRSGVGRRAAFALWDRFPGRWMVRVSEANRRAVSFWSAVVAEYAGGAAAESVRPDGGSVWRVFTFETRPR